MMTRRRLFKILGMLVFVGGLFGAAIIFLIRFVDGPVQGKMTTVGDVKASIQPTPQPPQQLAGLYVRMSYPATFDQLARITTDSLALEQYNMGSQKDYRQAITVHVAPLPTGDMMEDSSYRIRADDPATYKSTPITSVDKTVLMTKLDKSEQTLFVYHAAKLLTVSATSTSTKTPASEIMAVIQPSIAWTNK